MAKYGNSGQEAVRYISKSDYIVARECPTKLFFKKHHYPSQKDDDSYLEMLADGGFTIGKIAQLLHTAGTTIETLNVREACAQTAERLQQQTATLFEAAFFAAGLLARIDVLKKDGNDFELIEVKSKAIDAQALPASGCFFSERTRNIRTEWRPYLEDVTFQRHVLGSVFPEATIRCFLMVPNKAKATGIEGLAGRFSISRQDRNVRTSYTGDVDELRRDGLLVKIPVDQEVEFLLEEVIAAAKMYASWARQGLPKPACKIGYHCRQCEYRVAEGVTPNGFMECWGELAKPKPHLFDLYHLGAVRTATGLLADKLIARGKTALVDIDPVQCTSAYRGRQQIQIKHSKTGTEWMAPGFAKILSELKYPLHFIDFETSRLAVPSHRGMHPFELVAFQWSCHTVLAPGAAPLHQEWINLEQGFPNAEFARTLRQAVGETGTLLTWATHERTTLREIYQQMGRFVPTERELPDWLERQVERSGRIVDLCRLAEQNYFHPDMAGKLSIKSVLPAVWNANPTLHAIPWFAPYYRVEGGHPADPYKTLPPLSIYERNEVVNEGTGAMRAYQEMLYGESSRDPAIKTTWRKLLLQYCCLDTMAMLIIWEHWRTRNSERLQNHDHKGGTED